MTDPMRREYYIYLRKSRGRAGIARQRTVTTAYITRDLGGTVADEFTDEDSTAFQAVNATRPRRDDFDNLIAALRAHPGSGAAAWHADRFTRNPPDTELLLSTCATGHNPIATPSGGIYDVTTANGRKRLRQDALDAAYEVDHMTERIMAAKDEARAAGEWLGGRRPFGWSQLEKGEPTLILCEPEAQAVAEGTAAVLAGTPVRAIERAWKKAGIRTSGGHVFTGAEIRRVLLRARNAGLAEYGGKIAGKAAWPAIVEEKDWLRCKAILENPARRTSPGNQPCWLLSGIATCGVCGDGTTVIAQGMSGKGRPSTPFYRCRARQDGRRHVARAVATTDNYVSELVIAWVTKYGAEALQPKATDITPLVAELNATRAELETLTAAAEERSITAAQLIRASRPLHAQVARLESEIAAAANASPAASLVTGDDIRAGWGSADLFTRRAVVRALMTVTLLPSPKGRPAGHKPGESYFRPDSVRIGWVGEGVTDG